MSAWIEDVVQEAGQLAMSFYDGDYEVFRKKDDSPVTTADLEVDRFLHDRIREHFAEDCILSEETDDDPGRFQAKRVWIIDPIDGTALFIARRREFAILVALWQAGDIVESVTHLPALNTTLYSHRDQGCFSDGARVEVSRRNMGTARISCWGDRVQPLHTAADPMRESNLALIDLASGRLDACIFEMSPRAGEHDIACACGAIRDAGGRVSDGDGRPVLLNKAIRTVPNTLVCSNGEIHEELLAQLAALRVSEPIRP